MKLRVLLLVTLVALASVLIASRFSKSPDVEAELNPLNFSAPDLRGQSHELKQWRGKIVVLNFWATWCAPCLREIPEFKRWQAEFASQDLQFVGIAVDDALSVAKYLQDNPVNYPILLAEQTGPVFARQLGNVIDAVPFTVIIDQQGRVVHRQPAELSRAQFLNVFNQLRAAKMQ